MIQPGAKLKIREADRAALGREICAIIGQMEVQYADLFDRVKEAWSWYEAEKRVKVKTVPYEGASNVVIPLVRIHADATIARYMLLVKPSSNVWSAKTENDEFEKTIGTKEIVRFLNWGARNDFHADEFLPEWVQEMVVAGCGVVGLDWQERTVSILDPATQELREIVLGSGPSVQYIPRQNILWDTNYRVWDAPLVCVRRLMTWQDLILRANMGWDWEAIQKFKGHTVDSQGGGASKVTDDLEERSGSAPQSRPSSYGLYDIRRVYIDWPIVNRSLDIKPPEDMEEGDQLATIVVDLHPGSEQVLSVTNAPYAIAGKPYYDMYWKKRSGIASSTGLAHVVYDLQESASTFYNQSHDMLHKSICFTGVTSNPQLANKQFKLNEFAYSADTAGVIELGRQGNIMPEIAMLNQTVIFAERLTGINDPALGRETRMGGHPATATTTLQLLQEGKKLDISAISSLRSAMAYLGRDIALLYQQFGRDDQAKVVRAVGKADGQRVMAWLNGPSALGMMEFDLASVSDTMNPQLETQRAAGMFQITSNFYALVTQYLGVAGNPQAPPALVLAMLKGLQALQTSYQNILDAGDIDDTTPYLLDLAYITQQVLAARNAAAGAASGPPGPNGSQRPASGAAGRAGGAIGSGL